MSIEEIRNLYWDEKAWERKTQIMDDNIEDYINNGNRNDFLLTQQINAKRTLPCFNENRGRKEKKRGNPEYKLHETILSSFRFKLMHWLRLQRPRSW